MNYSIIQHILPIILNMINSLEDSGRFSTIQVKTQEREWHGNNAMSDGNARGGPGTSDGGSPLKTGSRTSAPEPPSGSWRNTQLLSPLR